jgi:hypothetical protein
MLSVAISIVLLSGGCNPNLLASNCKRISPKFCLRQFEGGLYYLEAVGSDADGGGILGGTVEAIGANRKVIVAYVRPNFQGEKPGWVIVDANTGEASEPMLKDQMMSDHRTHGISTMSSKAAWTRLR